MRSAPSPECAICGSKGMTLHADLPDRLFAAKGNWRLSRCVNPECRLLWLDPMPLVGDLGLAYAGYYTHHSGEVAKGRGGLRRIYARIKADYIARTYGYPVIRGKAKWLNTGFLLRFWPTRREDVDCELRYLDVMPGGKLLDVGCGSGDWMAQMKERGWEVWGVDFDPQAVQTARNRGLRVEQGSLEGQRYETGSFDAIVLNHVIEHVPDPRSTLGECHRLLKPGGKLALFTPNANSLGHWVFRRNWRGLEIPRHLHILSPAAARSLLAQAGFGEVRVRTVNSNYVWRMSSQLQFQNGTGLAGARAGLGIRIIAGILTSIEQVALVVLPDAGECLAAEAWKNAT